MQLQINHAGKVPIHEQLVEQIKLLVATGKMAPGRQLPTVRELARGLDVNASTVAKAYRQLERSGVIITRHGGGSSVADQRDERFLIDTRQDRLNAVLSRAMLEALSLGFEPDEVEARLVAHLGRWRERRLGAQEKVPAVVASSKQLRFAGSHDLAVELLLGRLRRQTPDLQVAAHYAGSLGGLIALAQGAAELAGTHLLDEETGEYNLPFVRRLLAGRDVVVITLVTRWQGLLVRRGNPKGVRGLEDLARTDLVFVNRQRGSGTRVLLDYRLRTLGIASNDVQGYEREEATHVAVAAAIADGSADAGLGIEAAARAAGLDFLPLLAERYDLVALRDALNAPWLRSLQEILRSEEFRQVSAAMGGYDVSRSGHVLV